MEGGRTSSLSYTAYFCSKLAVAEPNRLERPSRNRAHIERLPGGGRGPVPTAVAEKAGRKIAIAV